ncbi:ornithine carbamoyltransferase [Pseudalkalibacillus hwajinpoensis]|uniref:ornithine carbamoyltransferase n=1 Tax=Guptibacillus hwajinpoensis TaxID=208199 RepID=UPI001CD2EAB5|nr:ornithine carbamoyltransferase [Pseudalkalibacillus hwajinpoensis]MCA0990446.1 ornithine carbamoyltransferase [Pseudalkalibacillus hwajinpoensis]
MMQSVKTQNEIAEGMKGKDFLTIAELSSEEIHYLLQEAELLKKLQKEGILHEELKGKVLGMIFEKSSTRTRVSFEVAMLQLGGHALFLSSKDIQLGRGETVEDTANVLAGYLDGVMIRTFGHETIERFAKASSIPVINGLTDTHHPAQILADLLTIIEHKGHLSGLKAAYFGDGNNVAHSLIEGAAKVGMNFTIACPAGYEPDEAIVAKANEVAKANGSVIEVTADPLAAAKDADVLITDVWASMGQEDEQAEREGVFEPYQVNEELCINADENYIFMHCLPAHRGEEVTAEIIDGSHSVVYQEAENRLHAQKALLKLLLKS